MQHEASRHALCNACGLAMVSAALLLGCSADDDSGGPGFDAAASDSGAPDSGAPDAGPLPPVIGASIVNDVPGADIAAASVLAGVAPLYVFVGTSVTSSHTEVAITDADSACDTSAVVGKTLLFDFFHDATQPDSRVTARGHYSVWLPALSRGEPLPEDDRVVVTFVQTGPEGGMGFLAESGSVVVTDVSDDALSAELDLSFADGTMHGTFTAGTCAVWGRSASIPAPAPSPPMH
jgi:hypothetical protein